MNKLPNQKTIRAAVLSVCAGILIISAFHFFILVRQGRKNPRLPADSRSAPQKPSLTVSSTQTGVVRQGGVALPTVNYHDHRFAPATITLEQNAKGTGCVIQIMNQSDTSLTIRLSPHEKALKGNYGGQYDPIPPEKSIIIDPRFDMGYESFHNFNIPSEAFHVHIGNSCRSDL